MACPGSITDVTPEDTFSPYAAEGSVAHQLANQCWLLGETPDLFLGEQRQWDDQSFEVTEEMVAAVQTYLDFVEVSAEGNQVRTEVRLEHSQYSYFGGTIDTAIPATMHIIDFKYGAGIPVDPEENAQLTCYALLLLDHLKLRPETVQLSIVQPRAGHAAGPIRSWLARPDYLEQFQRDLDAVMSGSRSDELHAGDHCRWCPQKADCPELYELSIQTAQSEFGAVSDGTMIDMDAQRAAKILSYRAAITAYLSRIDQWVHTELSVGRDVPGYKLVNRYGNRRYTVDESEVLKACRKAKHGKRDIYKSELLSPAQLEKVVGKDVVAPLVERPHLGTTVVRNTDKREAVTNLSASEEFETQGTH